MKPRRIITLLFLVLALCQLNLMASTYLQVELKLKEGVKGDSLSFYTVDEREFEVKEGIIATLFVGNLTINLNYQKIDSTNLVFNLGFFTLAPEMNRLFKTFPMGLNHTYTLKDIKLKKEREFQLEITPKRFLEKEDNCSYLLSDTLWFYKQSVHYAFTFMEKSLADFFYNMNKNYLELDYGEIKRYFKFRYPQNYKIDYFICPCEISEAIWDKRLNLSLDPSKHKVYVLFDKEKESVDFPGPLLLLLYEFWGYAPAFVAEGASGYTGLSHYYAKKLKDDGLLIPLSDLEITSAYRKAPVKMALNEASSFISFLIDSYNMSRFKSFYSQVTDLSFDSVFEKVYSKTFSRVEEEWLYFLDRYKPNEAVLESVAERKFNYRYYRETIELLEDALKIYVNYSERENIIRVLNKLGGAYFSLGKYAEALRVYKLKSLNDTLNPGDHFILGSLYLIQGEKDSAKFEFLKALSLDSVYAAPQIKLGELFLNEGDLDKAEKSLDRAKKLNPGISDWVEIYTGLAKVYFSRNDSTKAKGNLYSALQSSNNYLSSTGGVFANPYVKIGEVYLSLGEVDSALVTFQIAEFMEDRPFYLGKIYLNMGELYEMQRDRVKAKIYYQHVLQIDSGYQEKALAQKRLNLIR
ncbi:MAG: hypothetical protein OEV55_01125 [candidate division Zixibacteria bacterium]|nr:hypothetical protein [candidate division Zixibacteria bacterium]